MVLMVMKKKEEQGEVNERGTFVSKRMPFDLLYSTCRRVSNSQAGIVEDLVSQLLQLARIFSQLCGNGDIFLRCSAGRKRSEWYKGR